jgi:hypothetical protein
MRPSDRHIDALLARGGLSGPEADRVLEAVLARRARRSWLRPWLAVGTGLGLAAAAVVLVIAPFRAGPAGFAPRGAGVEGAVVEVACLGHSVAACPRGTTLLFAVRGGSPGGYLAAWADPVRPGGERVWYFSADQETPLLQASTTSTQALSRGVRIGPEHAAGDYRLHVLLSDRPLSRGELAGTPPGVRARAELTLTITEPAAP